MPADLDNLSELCRTGEAIRHESDVNGDGQQDLVVHVRYGETGLDCGSSAVTVSGMTYDGRDILTTVPVTPR